jgi:hypothetical protein
LLGALADSPQGGVGLLAALGGHRHQVRDLFAMAGDYHLFAN